MRNGCLNETVGTLPNVPVTLMPSRFVDAGTAGVVGVGVALGVTVPLADAEGEGVVDAEVPPEGDAVGAGAPQEASSSAAATPDTATTRRFKIGESTG